MDGIRREMLPSTGCQLFMLPEFLISHLSNSDYLDLFISKYLKYVNEIKWNEMWYINETNLTAGWVEEVWFKYTHNCLKIQAKLICLC